MTRPIMESLENRQFLSTSILVAPLVVASSPTATAVSAAPTPAADLATTAAVLGRTYKGTYKIAGVTTKVSFELVKAYGNGAYAATVTDGGVKFDGNVFVSANNITVNWFTYDPATPEPAIVGTVQGALSADYATITGTVDKGGQTGTAKLTRSAVPVAEQNYTYSGTYTLNGVTKKIAFQLIKGYGRGIYYINVWDGGRKYDGNLYSANGVTYINWFRYNANYDQIPVGSIAATASADGNTLAGTVTKGTQTGTVIMTRPGVAPSPV